MDDERLRELRALLAKATKRPWVAFDVNSTWAIMKGPRPRGRRERWPEIVAWPGFDSADTPKNKRRADLHLIVEAVNALPDLLDEIARLKGENAEMLAGLREECRKRLDAEIALYVLLKATRDEPERMGAAQEQAELVLARVNEEGALIDATLASIAAIINSPEGEPFDKLVAIGMLAGVPPAPEHVSPIQMGEEEIVPLNALSAPADA